jgi:hypothetical protein
MSVFKLQIGLTDIEKSDNFAYDNIDSLNDDSNIKRVRYNIIKQSDEDEKAVVEWELNTDLPAVQNAIKYWEHTIRRPHLSMIQIVSQPALMLPTHFNFEIYIDFINLIPMTITPDFFVNEDYENLRSPTSTKFGDLEMSMNAAYENAGHDFIESSEYAVSHNTLDFYNPDAKLAVAPRFKSDFLLSPYTSRENKIDLRVKTFLDTHSKELMDLKVTEEHFLRNYGRLKVGTLITDPMTAYDSLVKYSRICRTSIVKED